MSKKNQSSKIKVQNFLKEVIEKKKRDLKDQEKAPSLFRNVIERVPHDGIAIIAEIKFASPTNPNLGSSQNLLDRAKEYEKSGADAISVITEKHFFKGDLQFVSEVKKVVKIPVLQKDFVIDEQQIYEAGRVGADALLFIARLVSKEKLQVFVALAQKLGIEPVVEVFDKKDLKKAVATKTRFIAVNARNLDTFAVDVDKAYALIKKIPEKFIKLGFSGIQSRLEVQKYVEAGARGVLVGTSLMKAKNIGEFISSLRATKGSVAI